MNPAVSQTEFQNLKLLKRGKVRDMYDLGEHLKMGLLSLPEGDDKILKYPSLFSRIDVLVVTKMDLLPHMEFDPDRVEAECRSLNPEVRCFRVSARTGEGNPESGRGRRGGIGRSPA